jgi:hypothetical protein
MLSFVELSIIMLSFVKTTYYNVECPNEPECLYSACSFDDL